MKKLIVSMLVAGLSLTFLPNLSGAAPVNHLGLSSSEASSANALLLRLDEIKSLSKTNLSSPEKRELRKEVRSIRQQLTTLGGGIYISAGALIVIVILLIILL
jgi:hypothetical protein